MTTVADQAAAVRAALGAERVDHRPNHTGASKRSYAVQRGADRLWVRVAADAAEDAALVRWAEHARALEEYGAPPVLDVLRVTGRTTLVMPHLPDPVATRADVQDLFGQVLGRLARLHADRALGAALGEPVTAREAFTEVWVRRFEADLEITDGFVARDEHAWMADQVDVLTGLLDDPSFDEVCTQATHGDPWHENLLVGEGRLWLLDWEDLAVGDPVVDESIVLFDAHGPEGSWPGTPRHQVARRALMLDAVVDVAADAVHAHDPLTRSAKWASYARALEAYRGLWS